MLKTKNNTDINFFNLCVAFFIKGFYVTLVCESIKNI